MDNDGMNGDGGLLSKMPNVVEEDVTIYDEAESICRRMYGFVGGWNELVIYEKISEIID